MLLFLVGCNHGGQTSSENYYDYVFELSDEVHIHSRIYGDGPLVVMLPGLGLSGIDYFTSIAPQISNAGYTVVTVDPRGVGKSTGDLDSITLHDMTADVASIIQKMKKTDAIVVGWAFGNRVARCFAADYPELTKSVILLAAGGLVPLDENILSDFVKILPGSKLSEEEKSKVASKILFSPKSDPNLLVKSSFYPKATKAQQNANKITPRSDWWTAGEADVLIIQGLDDLIAVPENGRLLQQQLGRRAKLVEISDAGHALHLEKPNEVVLSMINYLNK